MRLPNISARISCLKSVPVNAAVNFVGLSRIRETSVFGPSPDEDQQRDVWIVLPAAHIPAPSETCNVFASATAPSGMKIELNAQQLAAAGATLHRQGRLAEAVEYLQQAASQAADGPRASASQRRHDAPDD